MKSILGLFRFLGGHGRALALSIALLMGSVLGDVFQPRLIQVAIDSGVQQGQVRVLYTTAAVMLLLAVASAAANTASGRLLISAGQRMAYGLRRNLYRKVMSFSFADLDAWRTGELMVRLNSDVNTMRMFVRQGVMTISRSVVMIIGSLAVMFLTDARLATVMAIIMPSTVLVFFFIATRIRPLFLRVRESLDQLNNALQENLAGAKLVRAFNREDFEVRRFDDRNRGYTNVALRVGYTMSMVSPFLNFVGQLALVATLWFGGTEVIRTITQHLPRGLTLGQLVAFNNYALLAMFPISMLGFVLNFVSAASASAQRIEELLAVQPAVRESPEARLLPRLRGRIELRKVSLKYGEADDALSEVDLQVEPGQLVGIIGPTGSGKSSLASLIPRFYDPQEGAVLLDGADVRELALETLRTRVSMVLQETVLFARSIRENVAFGRQGATQAEIERACETACAREFIPAGDNGWDRQVGERGAGLSGGQRQRVAIARALLAEPDILILDDATSSVDARTERRLIANIREARRGRTTIVISQKIAAVRDADRIFVLDAGRIVGAGTHEELERTSATYAAILESQSAHLQV